MPYRPQLREFKPYSPQPPIEQLQERLGLERIVKLASNEGAFGPTGAALHALNSGHDTLNRYPDGAALHLREALAEQHFVKPNRIVIGNGADELIRLAGLITLGPGDNGVFTWPSFPTFAAACLIVGAEAVRVAPGENWQTDLDALRSAVNDRTRVVFIANPNNPTGTLIPSVDVREFVKSLPDTTLCVLDEAYAQYAAGADEPAGIELVREGQPRLIVLRTFSKVHGLAALRIGYAVASREAAEALNRARNIFNVNQVAQNAALASLTESAEIDRRVGHAQGARKQIFKWLALAGHTPVVSHANFVFAVTKRGNGVSLANDLMKEGVLVRALDGFGAPEAIRVTCGTDEENDLFAAALDRVS